MTTGAQHAEVFLEFLVKERKELRTAGEMLHVRHPTYRRAEGLAGHHAVAPLDVERVLQQELFGGGHVQEAPVQVADGHRQLASCRGSCRRLLGSRHRTHADKQQQLHGDRLSVPRAARGTLKYAHTMRPLDHRPAHGGVFDMKENKGDMCDRLP